MREDPGVPVVDGRVTVRSGGGDYPVVIGAGLRHVLPSILAEHAPAHRYAVISDDRVAPLYAAPLVEGLEGAGVRADLFVFPHGEASKNRDEWARLTDAMLSAGHGRDSVVIAVGGGVTGDLAGFVASTYQRGIPVVQVPTSLVAMIDASVGGKTGLDVPAGKNLVGAFHPPRVVVADPETILTLPPFERGQGLVEAMKHGAILDDAYLRELVADSGRLLQGEVAAVTRAVSRSVSLKAGVVTEDEREAGYREILNFGHTLGHAIEAASALRVPHGSAVAAGMVLEARLGERVGVTESGSAETLLQSLRALGPDIIPPIPCPSDRIASFLSADKKARKGSPRFVLLRAPGEVCSDGAWSRELPMDTVETVLRTEWPTAG